MSQSPRVSSPGCDSTDDGDSISADDMRRAEQMARELVVPPKGNPSDHTVPLTALEKAKARALVHRLVTPPTDARHDIKNLAEIRLYSKEIGPLW